MTFSAARSFSTKTAFASGFQSGSGGSPLFHIIPDWVQYAGAFIDNIPERDYYSAHRELIYLIGSIS